LRTRCNSVDRQCTLVSDNSEHKPTLFSGYLDSLARLKTELFKPLPGHSDVRHEALAPVRSRRRSTEDGRHEQLALSTAPTSPARATVHRYDKLTLSSRASRELPHINLRICRCDAAPIFNIVIGQYGFNIVKMQGVTKKIRRPEAEKFGRVVRRFRERDGTTQEELAERSGISATYVGFIERGDSVPTLTIILQLADALGVSASELLRDF